LRRWARAIAGVVKPAVAADPTAVDPRTFAFTKAGAAAAHAALADGSAAGKLVMSIA
jgi:NADPH:quinone reductase-like Zn-dependent oxidoreductase